MLSNVSSLAGGLDLGTGTLPGLSIINCYPKEVHPIFLGQAAAALQSLQPTSAVHQVPRDVLDVVNPGPEQDARRQRRKGLSTGFPCWPRLGRIDSGENPECERRDRHAASLRRPARRCS